MITLNIKPLSVNSAWKGKRYKSKAYDAYTKYIGLLLNTEGKNVVIPEGNLFIKFVFGFSNAAADLDNPIKPILDLLQQRFSFNDSRVYRIEVEKQIVKKGSEFVKFQINKYDIL